MTPALISHGSCCSDAFWAFLEHGPFPGPFPELSVLAILASPIQEKSVVDSAKGTVTVPVDADVVVGAQQQHQPICCGFCHHDANQQERRNIGEERAWSTMPDAEAPSVA